MIGNLRATTDRNTEQDWLKTNLAKFSRMMQGQRDLFTVAQTLLSELVPLVNAHQGVMYIMDAEGAEHCLKQLAGYADTREGGEPRRYRIGEGLVGQCAVEKQRLMLSDIPEQLDPDRERAPDRAAAQRHRAAGAVRRRGEGGDRARLADRVHRLAPRVPRAAHRLDRHRAEHDRSDDAHRGPAQAVAGARRRAADAAERAAADQRRARAESAAARRAERRGRAQEPGDRPGPARGGRESRGARAHLALQVRVPGEHVARAAHAAQLDPDPRPAARREQRRQPLARARSSSRRRSTARAPTF